MELNKAKVNMEHFVVINEYGFIENCNTRHDEDVLNKLSTETYEFFNNYCKYNFNQEVINIRSKRNTIQLELSNGKNKFIK